MKFLSVKNKNSEKSDSELLRLFMRGNNQTYLAELFNRYAHLIYLVCAKYLKDSEAAKDAVMDIYEKLANIVENHKIDNFKGWIYTVSKNHCLMSLRKDSSKGIKSFSLENNFMEYESFLNQDNDEMFETEKVRNKIKLLKEKQRECIDLFYFEKLSYKEIAQIISEPEKKVKSYLQNGKRNLRKLFLESLDTEE